MTEPKTDTWHLTSRGTVLCGRAEVQASMSIDTNGTVETMRIVKHIGGYVCPHCAGRARKVRR